MILKPEEIPLQNHSTSPPLPLWEGRRQSTLFPPATHHRREEHLKGPVKGSELQDLLTQLADTTLQPNSSKSPYKMSQTLHTPTFSLPQELLLKPEAITLYRDQQGLLEEGETQEMVEPPIQVSKYYPYPEKGIELLEMIHSLRLLYPFHTEGLGVSQILELEKTFRHHPYPWTTTLLMREVVQAYNPLMENRKDLPYMVTSMLPSIKAILYQETWDFIMLALMPALVGYLSPLGWQQIYITLSWMLHSQTGVKSPFPLETTRFSRINANSLPQSIPEGMTSQMYKIGKERGYRLDKFNLTDYIKEHLETTLIDQAEYNKETMQDLVEHVIAVDNICSGRLLAWLSCDYSHVKDDPLLRKRYLKFYKKVISFGGDIIRTTRGPRIIMPIEQWKNWEEMDYKTQDDFSWIIFMMVHQFSPQRWREAFVSNDYSLHSYFIDFMWETGAYNNINQITYKELMQGYIQKLDDSYQPDWIDSEDKPNIYLPTSGTMVCWHKYKKGWYRLKENLTWNDLMWSTQSTPEGGNWPNQEDPEGWKSPTPSKPTSMWGSPSHSLTPLEFEIIPNPNNSSVSHSNADSASLPDLINLDSDDSDNESIQTNSTCSSCDPFMFQSQFLSIQD